MLMLPSGARGLVVARLALADLHPSEVLHLPMNPRRGSVDPGANWYRIQKWKTMVNPHRETRSIGGFCLMVWRIP